MRRDFVEDGIDFAADEIVGWFGVFAFLSGPWGISGEATTLFALEELKWPGEFGEEIVRALTAVGVPHSEEDTAEMRAVRDVIVRDQRAKDGKAE